VDGSKKDVHAYKKAGDTEFTISTDFPGGKLYAVEGNQVFLISSNNNRPEIYRAEGGTNSWEKIFTATTGISMEHSNALIADGKLFVYAMQKATRDARPIYIQMYDLDIAPIDTSRYLSFKNLAGGQEIPTGSDLSIEANVGSAFKEVSLWSGDTNLGTLTSAPFIWSDHPVLTNMTERIYTFTLVAKDSADIIEETSITIYTPEVDELAKVNSLFISFEDEAIEHWQTDGRDYGVTPKITDGTNTRAGSKVVTLEYSEATSGHHVQNIIDKIVVPDQHYFHLIAYTATNDITYGKTFPTAKLGDWAPTPTFTGHSTAMEFERKITSRRNTQGDSVNCYPRLRSRAQGGACIIYYDDIVLYAHDSSAVDLEPPAPADSLTLNAEEENKMEISWTEGVDDLTGVTATLIFRTTNQSGDIPDLKPQVAYGTTGLENTGDWEVLETLPGGTTTFTDDTRTTGEIYTYALVHRDLAYNYSEPVLGEEEVVAVPEKIALSFKCYGVTGAIEFRDLAPGNTIAVYNITGRKVFDQHIHHSQLTLAVPEGIYIVKVAEEVVKIIVH